MTLLLYMLFVGGYVCLLQFDVALLQCSDIPQLDTNNPISMLVPLCSILGSFIKFTDAQVAFFLFTLPDPSKNITLDPNNPATLMNYDKSKSACFIIHGFSETPVGSEWIIPMAQILATKYGCNSIVVSYNLGTELADYAKAVASITLVVDAVVKLYNALNLSPANTIIVGHSLGSQIAGQVGKRIPNLSKIIASDPAGPCFDGCPKSKILNSADAVFVIMVHCNCGLMGSTESTGVVDFYPNGGKTQDDCSAQDEIAEILWNDVATNKASNVPGDLLFCSHRYCYRYLLEAFTSTTCFFYSNATTAPLPTDPQTNSKYPNSCKSCSDPGCNCIGFNPIKPPAPTKYSLTTNKMSPYCVSK